MGLKRVSNPGDGVYFGGYMCIHVYPCVFNCI